MHRDLTHHGVNELGYLDAEVLSASGWSEANARHLVVNLDSGKGRLDGNTFVLRFELLPQRNLHLPDIRNGREPAAHQRDHPQHAVKGAGGLGLSIVQTISTALGFGPVDKIPSNASTMSAVVVPLDLCKTRYAAIMPPWVSMTAPWNNSVVPTAICCYCLSRFLQTCPYHCFLISRPSSEKPWSSPRVCSLCLVARLHSTWCG